MHVRELIFHSCGEDATSPSDLPRKTGKSLKNDSKETVSVKCGLCSFTFERSKYPAKHALVCPSCGIRFEHVYNEPKPNSPTNLGEYIFFHTAAHTEPHIHHFLKPEQNHPEFFAESQEIYDHEHEENELVSFKQTNKLNPNEQLSASDIDVRRNIHSEKLTQAEKITQVEMSAQAERAVKTEKSLKSKAPVDLADPIQNKNLSSKFAKDLIEEVVGEDAVEKNFTAKLKDQVLVIWGKARRSNYYSATITLLQSAAIVAVVIGLLNALSPESDKSKKASSSQNQFKKGDDNGQDSPIAPTPFVKESQNQNTGKILGQSTKNVQLDHVNTASDAVSQKKIQTQPQVVDNKNTALQDSLNNVTHDINNLLFAVDNGNVKNDTNSVQNRNNESGTAPGILESDKVAASEAVSENKAVSNDYVAEARNSTPAQNTETSQLQSKLLETEKKVRELESMYQQTLKQQGQIQNQSRRLVTETLLRESALILSKRPSQSLLMTLQAIRMFQELGQQVPELAKTILSDSVSKQTSGETLLSQPYAIITMSVSPNGKWLMTSHSDRSVWIWDLSTIGSQGSADTGYCVDIPSVPVRQLVMSSDERWLIGGRTDGSVQVWNMTLDNPAGSSILLPDTVAGLTSLQLSPDDRWLAAYGEVANGVNNIGINNNVAGINNATGIWLWDMNLVGKQGGQTRSVVLRGHDSQIKCITISPDSRW
ncbi:MAG: WD40 repeat domain-containing protein, partial [Thermoguttaceae bacterium]